MPTPTIVETVEAETYVMTKIGALAGGRVYNGDAPQGTIAQPSTYPLIRFQLLSGVDAVVLNQQRVWTEFVLLVTCADKENSSASIQPIMLAVDQALDRSSGLTANARVQMYGREQAYPMPPQVVNGIFYKQLCYRYRMLVQPIS